MAPDRETTLQALKALQPLHRELIRRVHHLGCTTEEIAADLNLSIDTVKRELHEALHAMHRLLR